jgi:hypothetical protein
VGDGVVRVEPDGPAEVALRLARLALPVQHGAQVVVGRGKVLPERQRLAVAPLGLGPAAQVGQGRALVGQHGGVRRPPRQGRPVVADGLLGARRAELIQAESQVVVDPEVVRVAAGGAAQHLHRPGGGPDVGQAVGQQRLRHRRERGHLGVIRQGEQAGAVSAVDRAAEARAPGVVVGGAGHGHQAVARGPAGVRRP